MSGIFEVVVRRELRMITNRSYILLETVLTDDIPTSMTGQDTHY